MSAGIEEKIVTALRGSTSPLKALDIAREIRVTKKEVNQVIYHIGAVERANPGKNPPLWRARQASSSPGDGGGGSAKFNGKKLYTKEECLDGREIFSPLSQKEVIQRGVSPNITGVSPDSTGISPDSTGVNLSPDSIGASARAVLQGNVSQSTLVSPREESSQQPPFPTVGDHNLLDGSDVNTSSTKITGSGYQSSHFSNVSSKGVKTTYEPRDKKTPDTTTTTTTSPGQVNKDYDKDIPKNMEQHVVDNSVNNSLKTSPNTNSSQKKRANPKKLAASFNNGGATVLTEGTSAMKISEETVVYKSDNEMAEAILKLLGENKKKMSTLDISKKLGLETRAIAMKVLLELERQHRVRKVEKDGLYWWSII